MTHDQWERGERLTIHNATREQLKWMVKDREETIRRLYEENEKLKKEQETLLSFMCEHFDQFKKEAAA